MKLSVRLTRGNGQWIECDTAQGRFYVNVDCALADVIAQVIRGGHWVR